MMMEVGKWSGGAPVPCLPSHESYPLMPISFDLVLENDDQFHCSSEGIQELEKLLGLDHSDLIDTATSEVRLISMTTSLPPGTISSTTSNGSMSPTGSVGSEDSFGLP